MDSKTKLKRVVIKEELVILTGDHIKALILNQFLYWSERTKDFDKFIAEEKERNFPEEKEVNIEPSFGWIYKSASELKDELMIHTSAVTIRRHLTKLIKAGYIDQRNNPNHKWDRTLQYRPNIVAIQRDLEAMGYALDGYPLLMKDATFKMKVGNFKMKYRSVTDEGAIPETTTKITTKITTPNGENGSSKLPETESTPPPEPKTNHKLTDQQADELLIFGKHPDSDSPNSSFNTIQEIRAAGWIIRDHIVEQVIAYYIEPVRKYIPTFSVPNNKSVRDDWYKAVKGHLQDYRADQLKVMYPAAVDRLKDRCMTFSRPGSLTKSLPDVAMETQTGDVVAWL